jgi:heme exporter protein A
LTGPNGAGKSTLLRTIAGRLPATGGDINCAVPIIYVGHTDGLSGAISGRENLAGWAKINGFSATETAIDTALSSFATNRFADLPVRVLSRGQRRRLALARLALAPANSLGFWTNPMLALIRHQAAFLTKLCKNMQRLVAWCWQQRILILPQRQSRDHCICPGW